MAIKKIKKEKEDKDCGCGCDCGPNCKCKCYRRRWHRGGGALYFLGFLGSAIYFISHTSGFWNVVLAILKACVWPVFVTLKILGL